MKRRISYHRLKTAYEQSVRMREQRFYEKIPEDKVVELLGDYGLLERIPEVNSVIITSLGKEILLRAAPEKILGERDDPLATNTNPLTPVGLIDKQALRYMFKQVVEDEADMMMDEYEALLRSRVFLVHGDTWGDLMNTEVEMRQNFLSTMRLPFNEVFVSIDPPPTVEDRATRLPERIGVMDSVILQLCPRGIEENISKKLSANDQEGRRNYQTVFKQEPRPILVWFISTYFSTRVGNYGGLSPLSQGTLEYVLVPVRGGLRVFKRMNAIGSGDLWSYPKDYEERPLGTNKSDDWFVQSAVNLINFLNASNIIYLPYYRGKPEAGIAREHIGSEAKGKPDYYILHVTQPRVLPRKRGVGSGRGYAYEFDVRGHFRFLQSEHYKKKRWSNIWIPPYRKGQGLYTPKTYEMDYKPDDVEANLMKEGTDL